MHTGAFRFRELALTTGQNAAKRVVVSAGGAPLAFAPGEMAWEGRRLWWNPKATVTVPAGQVLEIAVG